MATPALGPDAAPTSGPAAPGRPVLRRPPLWLGAAAMLSTAGAITIAFLVRPPQTEWSAVVLWAAGIALWCLACRAPAGERSGDPPLRPLDLAAVAGLILVAAALLLPALEIYPLEIVGDPVRDGGLFTREFADGSRTEIFQYGFFNGFSLLVPFLGVPFYVALGASSLVFKGLAALAGLAAPPLLFLWARRFLPRTLAIVAALLMTALPIYLFYARREPVVAFNPPIMIAILAALMAALERDAPPRRLALLGLVAGVAVYFHGAVKAAAFLALALAGLVTLWRSCIGQTPWRRTLTGGVFALLGVVIGFGPLLLVTDLDVFLSRQRLGNPTLGLHLPLVVEAYWKTLRVFFDRPTTSWFPTHQPFIPSPALSGLFFFGAVLGWLALPARLYGSLLFFVFVLSLTNSAMTDSVNGDHRLAPLLPVVALLMTAGLAALWDVAEWLRRPLLIRIARVAVVVLALAAAAPPVYRFFADEQAKRPDINAHLLYFALHEIRSTPALRAAPEICVGGNTWVTKEMHMLHILDGWRYYLPNTKVNIAHMGPPARNNDLFVSTSCEPRRSDDAWRTATYCSPQEPFICPSRDTGFSEVRIHVDATLVPPR